MASTTDAPLASSGGSGVDIAMNTNTNTHTAMDTAMATDSDKDTDIVTQLQSRLDELATQLYAALRYTSTHHPSTAPSALAATVINAATQGSTEASQSFQQTQPSTSSGGGGNPGSSSFQQAPASPSHVPQAPETFEADLQELAVDLVAKQVEIETLIARLPPDLDAARHDQDQRIRQLAGELLLMEDRSKEVERRREGALARVEAVIGKFGRA